MTQPYEPRSAAEAIAMRFHEAYERLAPEYGYQTRTDTASAWTEGDSDNRRLMTAVVAELIGPDGPLMVRFPGDDVPGRTLLKQAAFKAMYEGRADGAPYPAPTTGRMSVSFPPLHDRVLRVYEIGRAETRTLAPQGPHRYSAGHSGRVCDALVLLADQTGDSCGAPFGHPIHDVACTCPETDPAERGQRYSVSMLGLIEPHAVGCPRHGYPNGVSTRCMRCLQVDGNHIAGCPSA